MLLVEKGKGDSLRSSIDKLGSASLHSECAQEEAQSGGNPDCKSRTGRNLQVALAPVPHRLPP